MRVTLLLVSCVLCLYGNAQSQEQFLAYSPSFELPVSERQDYPTVDSIVDDTRFIKPKELSFTEEQTFWLLDIRNDWSEKISLSGGQLDAFFAGKQSQIYSNASYMRLRLGPTFAKEGKWDTSPDIKFKLNLPLTKEKYRFVLESDPDDSKSLTQKAAESIVGGSNTERENATGALRYISDFADGWTLTNDIGVKIRWPPDPFARTKAQKQWQLPKEWTAEVLSSAYWFQADGLGANFIVNLDKTVSSSLFFRSTSEVHWIGDDDKFEFSETLNLYHTWDKKRVVRYRTGLLAESQPNPRTSKYYLDTTYRQKLYRNWLFYEIIPAVVFPRDDTFKPDPSITVKLEVLFSKN